MKRPTMNAKEASKMLREAAEYIDIKMLSMGYNEYFYHVALLRRMADGIELLDELRSHKVQDVRMDASWALNSLLKDENE